MRLRLTLIGAALVVALAWTNWQVLAMERHIATGRPLLFELGSYDPRSLLQGDYMQLAYRVADDLPLDDLPARGQLAVRARADGVVTAARLHTPGAPLEAGELLVSYHYAGWRLNVGPDSFFFQEGEGAAYIAARYAELRVLPDGATVLVGLRDASLAPLGRTLFP